MEQPPDDCFYVALYNLEMSHSPCSLVKVEYEGGQWCDNPRRKSVPMNEMRTQEIFANVFTLRDDLILIVTNLRFIFFDDDLEVLQIISVNSACSLG